MTEKEDAEFRRATADKACLATKLAVTAAPCRHGYTWWCPHAADLVAFLAGVRGRLQIGDGLRREIEEIIPFVTERRVSGPVDRRQPRWTRLEDCCQQCGSGEMSRRLYVTKGSGSFRCDSEWHDRLAPRHSKKAL